MYISSHLSWMVLVLVCGVAAQSVCSSKPTLINLAYDTCRLDPVCMDSFYLTDAEDVWERPRFDYLLLKLINTFQSNVTLLCSEQEIFNEWFSVVSNWNFCRRNEVYSLIENRCSCKSGKNCDLTMNGTNGYTTRELQFLIVLVLLGGAYYFVSVMNGLAILRKANKSLPNPGGGESEAQSKSVNSYFAHK